MILFLTNLDFFAFWSPPGLLCTLLPLFRFTPFDPVDSEFDAGGRVLGGRVGDRGRHLFVPTFRGTAFSSCYTTDKETSGSLSSLFLSLWTMKNKKKNMYK